MCHLKILQLETLIHVDLRLKRHNISHFTTSHQECEKENCFFFVKTFPASIFSLNLPFVSASCENICTTIETKLMTAFNQCYCLINFHLLLNFCANKVNVRSRFVNSASVFLFGLRVRT